MEKLFVSRLSPPAVRTCGWILTCSETTSFLFEEPITSFRLRTDLLLFMEPGHLFPRHEPIGNRQN